MTEETKQSKQFFEKYRIETEIGRGSSGICYRVLHSKSRIPYAMKKIHINSIKKNSPKEASSEVSILSKIEHPNIIKYYESYADESNLYIIMQYAPKGDLHNILKRRKIKRQFYSEQQIWEMSRQMLSALQYLHKNSIIHRDVKTLNIFVDHSGKLYLGDLGVSRIIKTDSGLYSRVGTPLYLAPEIIKYQKYDYKADIWGLGCVVYLLATLNHPFQGKNIISLGQNIVFTQPKPIQTYSVELNCFIMEMLEKNSMKRPSPSELLKKYASFFYQKLNLSTKLITEEESKVIKLTQTQEKNQVKSLQTKNQILNKSKNSIFDLRYNNIKKKMANNYVEQGQKDFVFSQCDKIKEENTSKSIKKMIFKQSQNKNYCNYEEETIVLSKKIQAGDQEKKYAEITHKNQCIKNQIADQIRKKNSDQFIEFIQQNKSNNIISGRKIAQIPIPLQSDGKEEIIVNIKTSFNKSSIISIPKQCNEKKSSIYFRKSRESDNEDLKPSFSSFIDVNKLPTQNKIIESKRIRPKSSIINKERHQSTLRVLKKSTKNIHQQSDLNKYIETQYLKSPQMVIL